MSKVENWHFPVIGETNSPDWILMVAAQVKYIPFVLAFMYNFKKVIPVMEKLQ